MHMIVALVIVNALALVAYMTVCFLVAYKRKRLDTVDAAWGGGFVVAATMMAGINPTPRTIAIMILVDIWAVRLSSHIIERSRQRGEDDQRYVTIAKKWGTQRYWLRAYYSIFLLQGLLVVLISLPAVVASGRPIAAATPLLIAGIGLWIIGFTTEAIGDRQLRLFIADKKHKGKVLDEGLWHYSRHPNYLGEIVQWYGIGLIACGAQRGWIGLLGPLLLNLVIRFVSGVPPIENRKKHDPAYRAYMQHTNALLPRFLAKNGRPGAASLDK